MILLNLGIPFTWGILLLIPISLIGGWIKPKFTCLAYVVPIIYLIDCLLHMIKINHTQLIPYENFIILIGILHAIEGLLTTQYGAKDYKEITNYKKVQIAGGYQLDRKWYIPLLFFTIKGFYIPIVAIVAYTDTTLTMKPQEKAKKMGLVIKVYACCILLLAVLTKLDYIPLLVTIFFTPLLHELMFAINEQLEKYSPINQIPELGLRIVATTQSQDFHNPFSRGDIIETINEQPIYTLQDYEDALSINLEQYIIRIQTLEGTYQTIYCNKNLLQKAENIFLPPNSMNHKYIRLDNEQIEYKDNVEE